MIGLIILFLVCRAFYRLAKAHGKIGWRYAVSAFIAFYVWVFLTDMIFVSFLQLWQPEAMRFIPYVVVNGISSFFGLMMCWLYYSNLKAAFRHADNFTAYNVWRVD